MGLDLRCVHCDDAINYRRFNIFRRHITAYCCCFISLDDVAGFVCRNGFKLLEWCLSDSRDVFSPLASIMLGFMVWQRWVVELVRLG